MSIVLKNKNFAVSKLLAGIGSGDTSLTVLAGEGTKFPTTGTFRAVIWSQSYDSPIQDGTREIVTMQLSAGDVFTITRGQENTSAKAWNANDNVAHVITAGKIDEIEAEVNAKTTLAAVIGAIYPIGSLYVSTLSTNPGTLLGVGTWAAFGAGRVLVGLDAGQAEFDTVEETGGEKTHALSLAELAAHNHGGATGIVALNSHSPNALVQSGTTYAVDAGLQDHSHTIASAGSGTAHNNLQPYIVVYMWKRTA